MSSSAASSSRTSYTDDPLTMALLPPKDESPTDRSARLHAEEEAKRISDRIDEELKKERAARKKQREREVKVLLLGQSESGKSTCLQQFALMYSPNAFQAECISWRPVVYFNLVRSIRRILEAILEPPTSASTDDLNEASSGRRSKSPASPANRFRELQMRLSPLLQVEESLIRKLAPEDEDEPTHLGEWRTVGESGTREYFINSASWKKALGKITNGKRPSAESSTSSLSSGSTSEDRSDPYYILQTFRDDMISLWTDPEVRQILQEKNVRLQDSPGFFLNDITRITARKYVPTAQDVLNARLKTVGIIEHHFALDRGAERGTDWKFYDVGGARNQRHTWVPFFDDVNAIIFLAPISAFDQSLVEDPRINRIEDSFLLFKAICSNKLLHNVSIVLFLNKCDLLRAKLEAGVPVNKYIISYGDRPNDYTNVSQYFRTKFGSLHHELSPPNRELYIHLTSVNDTESTRSILVNVRDTIIKRNLQASSLI
ncbi:hypothetical protein BOTBODRAFT_155240 [Botryobasidium botryosum FD-172 SS1]|uniref:G-alpha-domain-containing protein n=1 Tax=Botryobasidium botryosum (strain FD-172 SS1) TaxID=930990 RepID=A0A067MTV4_BOTB1|nr:hypothetical protein BOTBODRAFT_155240 [Botryobasidium botryosum FD-172 SS1]